MKGLKRTVMMAAAGLALSATAQATTMFTAPASASYSDEQLDCLLVNGRTTLMTVTIEVADYSGSVKASNVGQVVQPGGTAKASSYTAGAYCKFTFTGIKRNVRGVAQYADKTNGHISITVPAQ